MEVGTIASKPARQKQWVCFACTLPLFLFLVHGRQGWAKDAGALRPTRIGVVDVSEIMKNYKKVVDIQRALDQQYEPRRKALSEDQKKIVKSGKHIKRLRERMDQNSVALFDEVQKFRKMVFLFEKQRRAMNTDFVIQMRKDMREVLNEIRAGINKIAERRNLGLVLRSADKDNWQGLDEDKKKTEDEIKEPEKKGTPSPYSLDKKVQEILKPRSTVDVIGRFKRNPVLYGSDPIDITKDVLSSLNEDYGKGRGK